MPATEIIHGEPIVPINQLGLNGLKCGTGTKGFLNNFQLYTLLAHLSGYAKGKTVWPGSSSRGDSAIIHITNHINNVVLKDPKGIANVNKELGRSDRKGSGYLSRPVSCYILNNYYASEMSRLGIRTETQTEAVQRKKSYSSGPKKTHSTFIFQSGEHKGRSCGAKGGLEKSEAVDFILKHPQKSKIAKAINEVYSEYLTLGPNVKNEMFMKKLKAMAVSPSKIKKDTLMRVSINALCTIIAKLEDISDYQLVFNIYENARDKRGLNKPYTGVKTQTGFVSSTSSKTSSKAPLKFPSYTPKTKPLPKPTFSPSISEREKQKMIFSAIPLPSNPQEAEKQLKSMINVENRLEQIVTGNPFDKNIQQIAKEIMNDRGLERAAELIQRANQLYKIAYQN